MSDSDLAGHGRRRPASGSLRTRASGRTRIKPSLPQAGRGTFTTANLKWPGLKAPSDRRPTRYPESESAAGPGPEAGRQPQCLSESASAAAAPPRLQTLQLGRAWPGPDCRRLRVSLSSSTGRAGGAGGQAAGPAGPGGTRRGRGRGCAAPAAAARRSVTVIGRCDWQVRPSLPSANRVTIIMIRDHDHGYVYFNSLRLYASSGSLPTFDIEGRTYRYITISNVAYRT
jgi:hypothetical protein